MQLNISHGTKCTPHALAPLTLAINPGDAISAAVQYDGSNQHTLSLKDITSGQSYSTNQSTTPADARSSAEWIAEAPTIQYRNGTSSNSTLVNLGTVVFSNASASLGNSIGTVNSEPIDGFSSGATEDSITLAAQDSAPLEIPSALIDSSMSTTRSFFVGNVPEPASWELFIAAVASLGLLRPRIRF